jgi:WD40 repeat protein
VCVCVCVCGVCVCARVHVCTRTSACSALTACVCACGPRVGGVRALLAHAVSDGSQSKCVSPTTFNHRVTLPSKVAWHPKDKLVAVGWESGEIVLWDTVANTTQELTSGHSMAVCSLTWSPGGAVLVSADRGGKVCLVTRVPLINGIKSHACPPALRCL